MNYLPKHKTAIILLSLVSLIFLSACSKSGDKFVSESQARSIAETNQGNSNSYSVADKTQLEHDVAKLLKGDEVLLRSKVEKVFALAELREKEGNEKEAIQLYEKGLKVNATNIPCQMKLASLLAKHKRSQETMTTATIVQEMAEDESLVFRAEELLKSLGNSPKSSKNLTQVDSYVEIVLIPLGTVNSRIIASLRDMLEQRMGIRFSIYPKAIDIGKPGRSFKTVFVNDYFRWLKERIGEDKFRSVVTELGFTEGSLVSSESKSKFIQILLERSGTDGQKALRDFDIELKKSSKQTQYDTGRLLTEIQTQFPLQEKSRIKGYLAVTNEDIFEGDSRFRFGAALPGHAIISYHRFTSDFNKEDQNRSRLLRRILKQALSSANFVLGIPRCTNPDCARAYPNSLPELDQKPDTLCSLCQERLLDYRHSAKR